MDTAETNAAEEQIDPTQEDAPLPECVLRFLRLCDEMTEKYGVAVAAEVERKRRESERREAA